jgi:hypothetical protein
MLQMYAANVCGKCWRQMLASNVGVKCMRISEIYAANVGVQSMRNCEMWMWIVKHTTETRQTLKSLRLSKYMRQMYASIRKLARQNLQLLTSSKSGWRALVQVMLPLLHVVLKWSAHSGRPAYMGGVSPVLYRLLYQHDLPKYLRPVQISAGAYIFTISWGKIKNLSRLISVLSLHFKFVHNHKNCPNSAATLLSP